MENGRGPEAIRRKIVPLDEAARLSAAARASGKRIVFANGGFDILHVGHARYLQGAKALGDFLIVGVNSDESLRRLKGPGRPVQPEASRALLVAAIAAVDLVVLFSDPDVTGLLRTLLPHVHCKGTDYTAESVPERHVAEEIGAVVAIAGDPKDHATRDILARIRSAGKEPAK